MISYSAVSPEPSQTIWPLLAEPARWRRWAPHLLRTAGLGEPEVQAGRRGVVILAPGVLVPVRIVGKVPGQEWSWTVGPVRLRHAVMAKAEHGSVVRVEVVAPRPLEVAIRATYGPLIRVFLANLVRVAGR